MAVTYTFSTQSGSIPLAQLDANFATPITIGNTSVQLGNTITTLNNITLANTTISGGNVTLTNVSVTTANVTTANITNAVIGTANVTTANVGTLTLTNALGTASGGTGLTSFTSGGVVYASSGSALSTGSALTFDGTNLGVGTSGQPDKLYVYANTSASGIFVRNDGAGPLQTWATFGTTKMLLDISGNLGIGTSSPSEKLTVSGNAALSRFAVNASPINTTSTSQSFARFQSTGADFYVGTESSTAGAFFPSSTAYAAVLYNANSTPMQFYTAGGLRMTLDSSGNFGIGTSSPGTTLDVNGTTRIRSDLYVYGTGDRLNIFPQSAGNGANIVSTNNGNTGYSKLTIDGTPIAFNIAGTGKMLLDSSGNLLVGTTSSEGRLSLYAGSSATTLTLRKASESTTNPSIIQSPADNSAISLVSGTTSGYTSSVEIVGSNTGYLAFKTATTERMRLDSSGNLTVPAMYGTTVTTPRNVFIDSSGKMGGISSTRASKTNISQLNSASWIYELNPVTFNYLKKDEEGEYLEEFEEEQQFGLIAEEVELVKPELCIYTDDKVSGIHYDRMIAPLIKAIQELKASNDALTARIAQLEAK
jgi:hypothetical protein